MSLKASDHPTNKKEINDIISHLFNELIPQCAQNLHTLEFSLKELGSLLHLNGTSLQIRFNFKSEVAKKKKESI
jgi:hypothetical protein